MIFLQDTSGRIALGVGSANLSVSGWGRNQEVFLFREVSSNDQYQQISRFFTPLATAAGVDMTGVFDTRRRSYGDDQDWRFVHSFEKKLSATATAGHVRGSIDRLVSLLFSRFGTTLVDDFPSCWKRPEVLHRA